MQNSLFSDFDEITAKQWKQKIQYELNGQDYNEVLISRTAEDINIKPFYHSYDNVDSIAIHHQGWKIAEKIYVKNESASNSSIRTALESGSECLYLIVASQDISLEAVFDQIPLQGLQLEFQCEFLSADFIDKITSFFADKQTKLHFHIDSIGQLARDGNWYQNQEKDFEQLSQIQNKIQGNKYVESSISIDAGLYQNAGANMVQQLAYTLAHANEYLNYFEGSTPNYCIRNSVSGHYFFEIAKLRAFRVLWANLIGAHQSASKLFIHSTPSKRNKTLYDYNVNMLRTTTEYMSAILGGSDSISFLPYDAIYHKDNEFSKRIARNQLLILRHESYFDTVRNPADGAYYIEDVCREMCDKAFKLFKQIEKSGGFITQLMGHQIQKKIRENAAKEATKFEEKQIVLVGTNSFENPQDQMSENLELYPFVKTNPRKTLIEPIIERRLSEQNEKQRLKTQDT
ncbi:methylmalonyl-CoA mutase subunit beta [Galbibacter sp.]|uniref:methylmalonyl-CoA mutase subunit beta n=1 Tax=Galbibacter sp. TaxID=2918471 RepID=UPI003A902E4D